MAAGPRGGAEGDSVPAAVAVGLAECGRRWSAAGRAGQESRWAVADGGGEEKAAAGAVSKVASAAVPPEMG